MASQECVAVLQAWLKERVAYGSNTAEHREKNEALTAAIDALQRQGWQPIDTAPIDTEVALWGPGWISVGAGCIADDGNAYEPNGGAMLSPRPTCWHPLPSQPNEEFA